MWFRQSITYSVDASEETEWERYSDFENEFIEEAFQRKDSEVKFNGCTINLHCSQQWHMDRQCVKVSIKRDEIHLSACMRKERFCYPHKLVTLFDSKIKQENTFFSSGYQKIGISSETFQLSLILLPKVTQFIFFQNVSYPEIFSF